MSGNLFEELKRRKVFKVGAAYLVVAWLAVQAASIGFPAFEAPPWALRVFILIALLGVVLAWVFESTPDGMQFVPVAKDAFEGPSWPAYLARIHATNGDAAKAVALLRPLLAARVGVETVAMLRLDPAWDSIRKDPGFQSLVR